jgi:hypothetical protein
MTESEYQLFVNWWEHFCRRGAVSFAFPRIDAKNGAPTEYRFTAGQDLKIANPSGDILEVRMTWETV